MLSGKKKTPTEIRFVQCDRADLYSLLLWPIGFFVGVGHAAWVFVVLCSLSHLWRAGQTFSRAKLLLAVRRGLTDGSLPSESSLLCFFATSVLVGGRLRRSLVAER